MGKVRYADDGTKPFKMLPFSANVLFKPCLCYFACVLLSCSL